MSLNDEFEIYDSCTADTLQIGDLIVSAGEYIEIHEIEDDYLIQVYGYSYNQDAEIELHFEPDARLDLCKIAS